MKDSTKRDFIVTCAEPGCGNYHKGERLSFSKEDSDEQIAGQVNIDAHLQATDLAYTGKNSEGEWCFAQHLDGRNFDEVLRIKEVA